MYRVSFFLALLASLAMLLDACGDGKPQATGAGSSGDTRATHRPIPAGLSGKALEDFLRADLAARIGIPASEVTIRATCDVTWPDGSLGVSEPGSVSAQVLSPGFLTLLMARGREYRYHGTASSFIAASFVPGATVDTSAACP